MGHWLGTLGKTQQLLLSYCCLKILTCQVGDHGVFLYVPPIYIVTTLTSLGIRSPRQEQQLGEKTLNLQ